MKSIPVSIKKVFRHNKPDETESDRTVLSRQHGDCPSLLVATTPAPQTPSAPLPSTRPTQPPAPMVQGPHVAAGDGWGWECLGALWQILMKTCSLLGDTKVPESGSKEPPNFEKGWDQHRTPKNTLSSWKIPICHDHRSRNGTSRAARKEPGFLVRQRAVIPQAPAAMSTLISKALSV